MLSKVLPLLVTFSMLVTLSKCSWLSDLTSVKGWRPWGKDLVLQIQDNKITNGTFMDRIGVKVEFGGYELNAVQNREKNALQVDLYSNDKAEGRANKQMGGGSVFFPFAIGAIKAAVATLAYTSVKFLVIKAIMVAKVALAFSLFLLIAKLHKKHDHGSSYLEVEHHGGLGGGEPYYTSGYGHSGYGAGGGGYSYGPSGGAESSLSYAAVAVPGSNDSSAPSQQLAQQHEQHATAGIRQPHHQQQQVVGRRKDFAKRSRPALLTITRYRKPDDGGLL